MITANDLIDAKIIAVVGNNSHDVEKKINIINNGGGNVM